MKEWKGNSDSVCSRLAINKAHTTKGRETDDFYATDPEALEKLLAHSSYYLHNIFCNRPVIWEPACGNGNLALILDKHDLPTYSSDLKNRGYGMYNIDFLQSNNFIDAQIILTNPPYSLANEFILHALDILPDGGGIYCLNEYILSLRSKALRNNIQQRHAAGGVFIQETYRVLAE